MKKKTIKKIGIAFGSLVALSGVVSLASSLANATISSATSISSSAQRTEQNSRATTNAFSINVDANTTNTLLQAKKVLTADAADVVLNKEIRVYNPGSGILRDASNNFLGDTNSGTSAGSVNFLGANQYNFAFRRGEDNQWYFKPRFSNDNTVSLTLTNTTVQPGSNDYGFVLYNNNDIALNTVYSGDQYVVKEKDLLDQSSGTRIYWKSTFTHDPTIVDMPINGVVKIQSKGLDQAKSVTNGKLEYDVGATNAYTVLRDIKTHLGESLTTLLADSNSNWSGNSFLYKDNTNAYLPNIDGQLTTTTSALNVGLYDGKIYLGSNATSITLAANTAKPSVALNTMSPQEFVDKCVNDPSFVFNYVVPTITNAPNLVLDGGLTIKVTNNVAKDSVDITVETNKSFKPNKAVDTKGNLVDSDWIKDEPTVSGVYSINYSSFKSNVTATSCVSSVNIANLQIPGVDTNTYADDFVNMSTIKQQIVDKINQNPEIILTNAPATNNDIIENGAAGITFANGSTTSSVEMKFNYLSNKGTIATNDDAYVAGTVTINGFKESVPTVASTLDLSLTNLSHKTVFDLTTSPYDLLTKYLKEESVLRTIFTGNVSDYFIQTCMNQLTVASTSNINGLAGTFTANITVPGLGTSRGFVDSTVSINFTGLKSVSDTSLVSKGNFNISNFPSSLSTATYFVDFEESSLNILKNMLNEMNASPSNYLDNYVPTENGEQYFKNLKLTSVNIETGTATFAVDYWGFENGTKTYKNATIQVSGFTNLKTDFNSNVASQLVIPTSATGTVSLSELDVLKSKLPSQINSLNDQKNVITRLIKENLNQYFVNIPLSFASKNTDLVISNFIADDVNGSLSFDVAVNVINNSGKYESSNFPFKITGFSKIGSVTTLTNSISISDLGIPGLSKTSYSVDFMSNVNEISTQLLNIVNSNPKLLLSNIPTSSQISNRPIFKFDSANPISYNSDPSKLDVSIMYLKSNGISDQEAQYEKGTFTINFNNAISTVSESYLPASAAGLALNFADVSLSKLTEENKNSIIAEINKSLGVVFNNTIPSTATISNFNIASTNIVEGSMIVSFEIQNSFGNNGYLSQTFSIKVSGFAKETQGSLNLISSISISELANISVNTPSLGSSSENTLFSNIVGKYASDAIEYINSKIVNFSKLLENVINENANTFIPNIGTPSFKVVKSGSITFNLSVGNSIEAIIPIATSASDATSNNYSLKTLKINGFNSNATQTTRASIINGNELVGIIGDLSKYSVDGAIAKLNEPAIKLKLISTLNEAATSFFKAGTIGERLTNLISSKSLFSVNNTIISKVTTSTKQGKVVVDGLEISASNIPVSLGGGSISNVGTFSVLNTLNDPLGGFNFGTTNSASPQAASSNDYTWVWILIGCLLGGALLIVLAYLLYRYLRNRPVSYKTSSGTDTDYDNYDDYDDFQDSYSDDYYEYF